MNDIIFSQENFKYMDNLIDDNCNKVLRKNEEYVLINKRISNIIDKVETLPKEFRELFKEYTILSYKSTSYDYCLLYYLGIKQGQK